MRFTFLGTGTSSGVPAIGCTCAVCTSTDPRDNRLRTGAAVRFTDRDGRPRTVLIDATPDLRQQALRFGLDRCDAILFTHNHVDHTFGLDEVRRYNALQQAPIDIYAEPSTLEFLKRVFKYIFDRDANVNDSFVANLIAWALEPARPIVLWGLKVTPIRLLHGRLPIVGFRLDRDGGESPRKPSADAAADGVLDPFPLAYCTDVSAVPPESWPALRGLSTLVVDGLRHRAHPTHFTVAQALDVIERVKPRAAYLTHISHDLGHAAMEAELPDGVHMAYDGLTLGDERVGEPEGMT
ncbi:MAG TPA: MBL fold metallo-hydrolase [Phycisphaerales bacterium]|nr:MBL fold metallo-hydrolase [Phycisphaerales bacterium]